MVAKARPGFDDRPEHLSVQINSSSPWCNTLYLVVYNLFHATSTVHCVLCHRYPTEYLFDTNLGSQVYISIYSHGLHIKYLMHLF